MLVVILAAENHFNTHPPLKCGVLSNWKYRETEQLHSVAAILCKLREVVMCNYYPIASSISTITPPALSLQMWTSSVCWAETRKIWQRGSFLKAPPGWHKAVYTQKGIKTTVRGTLLMCLTVASGLILISYWLQPFPTVLFTGFQSTCYNCKYTHTQRRTIQGMLTT